MSGKKAVPRLKKNYEISPGVLRFSSSRLTVATKHAQTVVKKIGGAKNGGDRKVVVNKGPRLLPKIRQEETVVGGEITKTKLRQSITPGTVLIILAGRHKGKRVVFLKQLASGLLLVTGPLKLSNTPIRRIAQAFVIATKTKIDVSKVKLPEHIDDKYFRRTTADKGFQKKKNTDIFAAGKEEYKVTDQRKADQKVVDTPILAAIRKHKDHKFLFGYLGSRFALGKGQYPHKMIF